MGVELPKSEGAGLPRPGGLSSFGQLLLPGTAPWGSRCGVTERSVFLKWDLRSGFGEAQEEFLRYKMAL